MLTIILGTAPRSTENFCDCSTILSAFHSNATVDNVCQNFLNSIHPLAKNSNSLNTLHFPPFTPLGQTFCLKVLYWERISNYVGAILIVVLPCMLTITQLLLQLNAHLYY
jgi:hypothetical protein